MSTPTPGTAAERQTLPTGAQSLVRMTLTELRLAIREPLVLAFVFAFPVVLTLVLGGIFDEGDDAFEGAVPSDYYAAAYVAIAIGAIGLIMLPTQIAAYRERGVLRRFHASGIPGWVYPAAIGLVSVLMAILAGGLVLVTAALSYGFPGIESPLRTLAYGLLAAVSFISFGILLGWIFPNSRAAQGVGLVLFMPMFLLGGGGPPPEAMPSTMNTISSWMPLTHVLRAMQEPWLGFGSGNPHALLMIALLVVSTTGWVMLSLRGQ